jgi:hypothetical protein
VERRPSDAFKPPDPTVKIARLRARYTDVLIPRQEIKLEDRPFAVGGERKG